MLTRALWITALAVVLVACGDDAGDDTTTTTGGDGSFDNATLTIVEPERGSLGLTFGEASRLSVRYDDKDGDPLSDAPVDFAFLVGPGEETGGAALSATRALTDADGIATIDLVAGARSVSFRVTASAEAATPVTFFVSVSDQGFVTLVVDADYGGQRADIGSVELRLYLRDQLACGDIELRALPTSSFPRQFADGFDAAIEVSPVIALRSYTVVVVGTASRGSAPVAAGCMNLGADQVLVGRPVQLGVSVDDLALILPDRLELVTNLDTTPAAAALRERGAEDLWDVLACPAGPGQLVLDCAIDALATSDEDPADCRVGLQTGDVAALQAARGALGGDGCRAADDGDGPTLDQRLTDAIAAGGGFPTDGALADLLAERAELLAGPTLASSLAADGPGLARHRLESLAYSLEGDGGGVVLSLPASARPLVEARSVELSLELGGAALGEHGFTLRLGSALATAFDELSLSSRDLGGQGDALATAAVESATADAATGCDVVSALACEAAGLARACLVSSCTVGTAAGDEDLSAWTRLLDGTDADLTLSGTGPVADGEPDAVVDTIGGLSPQSLGTWTATLTLRGGATVELPATFGTTPRE